MVGGGWEGREGEPEVFSRTEGVGECVHHGEEDYHTQRVTLVNSDVQRNRWSLPGPSNDLG